MELRLKGKSAVVTGGSKGLGWAIAEEFVREGASVAICARQESEVTAAAAELRSGGTTVYSQACDVTDSDRWPTSWRGRRTHWGASTSWSTTRGGPVRETSGR